MYIHLSPHRQSLSILPRQSLSPTNTTLELYSELYCPRLLGRTRGTHVEIALFAVHGHVAHATLTTLIATPSPRGAAIWSTGTLKLKNKVPNSARHV